MRAKLFPILIVIFWAAIPYLSRSQSAQAVMEVSVQVVKSISASTHAKMNGDVISGADPFEVGDLFLNGISFNNVLISLPEEIQLFDKEGNRIDLSIEKNRENGNLKALRINGKVLNNTNRPGMYTGELKTTVEYI